MKTKKMAELEQMHALSEPTYCRLKHNKNPALLSKLNDLENVLAVLKSCQKQQDKIMSEAKLLQIMIYKRRRQLRSEKSLQLVRRVQTCLKRASTFGRLFTLIDDIHKDLLSAVAEMKKNDVVYLPAQQTWSYLLYLQLQYLKLLDINRSYCIAAFNHLSCQFATGMLIPQMVIFMGIMARIWLLSGSIAEKIQSCYSLVYVSREHFSRTNSAWKEPVLPTHLQRSNPEDDCRDLQEMYSIANKVTVSDSLETAETGSLSEVLKNTVLACDKETEDIGVPIALTRTSHPGSSDNRSSKRKQTEENDFTPHKKRKQMNDSLKQDGVSGVSGVSNFSSVPAVKKKKKKKKRLEIVSSMEVKQKKNSNVQKGSVKSFLPKENNTESSHYVSGVSSISSFSSFSAERPTVEKKKKKKCLETASNTEVKQKNSSNLQSGSAHPAPGEDQEAESTHTHETSFMYEVQTKKQKKKKLKAISDDQVKHGIAYDGKSMADSPKATTKKEYHKTEMEDTKRKNTVAKSHRRKKLKKSKLKKEK